MEDKKINPGVVRSENIRVVTAPKVVIPKPNPDKASKSEDKPKTMKVVFRNDVLDKIHYKAGHVYDITVALYNKLKSIPSAIDHSKSLIIGYKGRLKPLTRGSKLKGCK